MHHLQSRIKAKPLTISLPVVAALVIAGIIGIWASLSHQTTASAAAISDDASQERGAPAQDTPLPMTLRIFRENNAPLYEGGAPSTVTVRLSQAPSDLTHVLVNYDPSGWYPTLAVHNDDVQLVWPIGTVAVNSNDAADQNARKARLTFEAGETDKYIEVHVIDDETIDSPQEIFSLKGKIQRSSQTLPGHGQRAALPIIIYDGVCDRTPAITNELMSVLGITPSDDENAVCWDPSINERTLGAVALLDVSDQDITSLKPMDFRGLPNLRTIDLSGNSLAEWPDKIFQKMTLTSLDIRDQANDVVLTWQMNLAENHNENGDCRISLRIPPAFPTSHRIFYDVFNEQGEIIPQPDSPYAWSTPWTTYGMHKYNLKLPDNADNVRVFAYTWNPILELEREEWERFRPLRYPANRATCPSTGATTNSSSVNKVPKMSAESDTEDATLSIVGTSASDDTAANVTATISEAQHQQIEVQYSINATTTNGDTILGNAVVDIQAGDTEVTINADFIKATIPANDSLDRMVLSLVTPNTDSGYKLDENCKSATVTSSGAVTACAPDQE